MSKMKKNGNTHATENVKRYSLFRYQFLYLFLGESESVSHSVMSDSLGPHGLQPARLLFTWDSPSKNTEVGCSSLLQGQNPGLLHCRQTLYHLSHQGSPFLGIYHKEMKTYPHKDLHVNISQQYYLQYPKCENNLKVIN